MNSEATFRGTSILRKGVTALLILASIGCADEVAKPPRAAVTGNVSFDGQPLMNGNIRFLPAAGTKGPKVSVQIVDGQFQLPQNAGPVVGNHRVEIEAPPAGDLAMDDEAAFEDLVRNGKRQRPEFIRIPPIYNSNSRLTATISADSPNTLQFELTSHGN